MDLRWQDSGIESRFRADVERLVAALGHADRLGPFAAWIIDDTGLPKKGVHSVGVARQDCGQPGK